MSVSVTYPNGGLIPRRYRQRAQDISPVGRRIVDLMRRGSQGIREQFDRERLMSDRYGTRPWVPSLRVIYGLGGSPRTMDNTGAYRAAWLGGAGARQEIKRDGVTISVDPVRFPQMSVNQRLALTVMRGRGGSRWILQPRPLGFSPGMRQSFNRTVRSWILSGKAGGAA